ncbi:GntR family transcriptional regulator [Hyphococcus luteus]|nr:GntR family transcriptional regulator [Marinicaulis flavus]
MEELTVAVPVKIADRLRGMIARGALPAGLRLGQKELAEQFNASRVPVREALKLLSSEGIVDHDPNRGFFVARLSSDEARQLFRMRDLIEDELLTTIEWPTKAQLNVLRAHAARLEKLLDEGDRLSWWDEHRRIHEEIFNLSPNKIIVNEAMRLWTLTDRFRAILPMPRRESAERNIVNKHNLVEALAQKDREKLLAVRRERRHAFQELVLETLEYRSL